MARKIFNRCCEKLATIPKMPESGIAMPAQQPAHFAGRMVMINTETILHCCATAAPPRRWRQADTAPAALRFDQSIVLLNGNAVVRQQTSAMTSPPFFLWRQAIPRCESSLALALTITWLTHILGVALSSGFIVGGFEPLTRSLF